MSQNFALSSNRVVTPDGEKSATVFVAGETIAAVVDSTDSEAVARQQAKLSIEKIEDLGNLVVSPGVFDAHVHINEPGRTEWEGFATATAAAAAGGVTTLIDMPLNSSPVTTSVDALRVKQNAARGKLSVDVAFYGGLVPANASEVAGMVAEGLPGIKAFLCHSGLDEFPAAGEPELRSALNALQGTGVPLLAHAEIVDALIHPDMSTPQHYRSYMESRPALFELAAIDLLIRLCREYQTPVHIVHLATVEALPMIRAAKAEGLPLTVETCPHYLYFHADEIADGQTVFKCAPPIRYEANRAALCAAVAEGVIDTIGSDHSPCPPEMKSLDAGDFFAAWGGICGLQLSLPVTWTVGQSQGWTPSLLAEKLSSRPAEIFGFGDCKGKLAPDFDADLVVWIPEQSFKVNGSQLLHRHATTPYEGRKLSGVVRQTFVRGRKIFDVGIVDDPSSGRIVIRTMPDQPVSASLNRLSEQRLCKMLETCCAAEKWIRRVASGRPFVSDARLKQLATEAWSQMEEPDLLQAFAAHPRIGDVESLRAKYANTKAIAGREQSGVDAADEATLQRLARVNDDYFEKFGFIFIVFATGKSAAEMLQILESRLPNDRDTELANAAAEQLKITLLRLEKLA